MRNLLRGGEPPTSIRSVTPNPVVGSASVEYDVGQSGLPVTIEVYDLLGQKSLIVMERMTHMAGTHTAKFDTSNLPSGSYVVRVSSLGGSQSRRFVVQK